MSGNRTMPARAIAVSDPMLVEIFSSVQGEGLYIGCRQIFIRLAECNLACAYCDTEFEKASLYQQETAPGSGFLGIMPNPPYLEDVLTLSRDWMTALPGAHHSFSITGGEPLFQAAALHSWLPGLQELLPVHLETNGTLPDELEPLLPHLDFISMDLKLASTTGVTTPWDLHQRFLALAAQRECQVKAVVGPVTSNEEVITAAQLVQEVAPHITLILQPLTRQDQVAVAPHRLLEMQSVAAAVHPLVRVIPQMHRFIAVA